MKILFIQKRKKKVHTFNNYKFYLLIKLIKKKKHE